MATKTKIRPASKKKDYEAVEIDSNIEMQYENVEILRTGDQIVLPKGMTYDEGIAWLHRQREEEETIVAIAEEVEAFPLDGAVAFMKVLKKKYGWTSLVPTPGFFGPTPPTMLSVDVGVGETLQVPWGSVEVPNIDGLLETGFTMKDDRPIFVIRGNVKRKHEDTVHEIAEMVRETVRVDSIYRGKAIKMTFRTSTGERIDKFHPAFAPKFVDVSSPGELILSKTTMAQVETSLFHPVKYTEQCRAMRIPLKRGVLLHGPFGTGKTLTAYVLAHLCEANGWSFIYLDEVQDLDHAIAFARLYQPCVVFAEDIDSAVGPERDTRVNRLMNTIDGVDSKTSEIMVVLTTNNVKVINPGFVRPGRIDSVVHVPPPDTDCTVRLVQLYGRDMVKATDSELEKAVQPIVGHNSAVIREAVERAKLSAVKHYDIAKGVTIITAEDIAVAADEMKEHVALLAGQPEIAPDLLGQLTDQLSGQVVTEMKAIQKDLCNKLGV